MRILIGISGGISAYKIYELIRLFVKNGDEVKVILTGNAHHFVNPLVVETLSLNKCNSEMFAPRIYMEHIELTRWADIMLIAPATANIIGKIANGIADDLLSTTVPAMDGTPVLIFPSMNTAMFNNKAVKQNMEKLRALSYFVFKPVTGQLACGEEGRGRLPEPLAIYNLTRSFIKTDYKKPGNSFKGKCILITAGATRAYIDPVRYITNDASGRTGVEIAFAFYMRGARIFFIGDKKVLERFPEIFIYSEKIFEVKTTGQVLEKAKHIFPDIDIYVSSAALSDFSNEPEKNKLKKKEGYFEFKIPTGPDVFKELSKIKGKQVMVGFALETENLKENALRKLRDKGMDVVLANDNSAIASDKTTGFIIDRLGNKVELKDCNKTLLAEKLVRVIENIT
ncbi:MAG: bifunctional phosphopantothenoylcysteine decarboxylase/phosphopantothenate--cysteine ligase CoaBC [Spirochaetes bacterium]|nr:bifunctional phosphopantothenoylcysteine decarboxylase/phosphopantothenate--cysteine ligase CoaBC [Spirochaetota bacterium]